MDAINAPVKQHALKQRKDIIFKMHSDYFMDEFILAANIVLVA
jgi:hypothetical protein